MRGMHLERQPGVLAAILTLHSAPPLASAYASLRTHDVGSRQASGTLVRAPCD